MPAMDPVLQKFLEQFNLCNEGYDDRVNKWRECDRAYQGIYKPKIDSTTWEANYHPPYIMQVIETIESFIVEGDPVFKVVPHDPESEKSAKVMERLLKWQMGRDYFAEKQSEFVKQALIRGTTVAKIAWVNERRREKRRQFLPVMGDYPIDDPQGPAEEWVPYRQQPSFLPVDLMNFWWDPSATCIEDCNYVFYRTYSTLQQLKAQGIYDNLDKLGDGENRYLDPQQPPGGTLWKPNFKGKIEVIERWTPGRLTVIANRTQVIRDIPNPFWHGQIPFIVATTLPQPFMFGGKSEAEILNDIQTMLWEFQCQRMDNVKLINNAIVILNTSAGDTDEYEFYPGAIWKNRTPQDVQMWTPNPAILSASVQTEQMIKQDLDSLSAALPYLSGAASDTIDNKTATGISIVSNLAQKRLLRKKQQINWAYARGGQQQIKLNQQLLPEVQRLRMDKDNSVQWENISPASIQGSYEFCVEDVSESINRQERRAEALAKAQFFISNYPLLTQAGVQIDLRPVVEDVAEAFDEPADKYLQQAQPMAAPAAAPSPPMGGGPGFPGLPAPPPSGGGIAAPGTSPEAGAVPPPQFAAAMNGSGGAY